MQRKLRLARRFRAGAGSFLGEFGQQGTEYLGVFFYVFHGDAAGEPHIHLEYRTAVSIHVNLGKTVLLVPLIHGVSREARIRVEKCDELEVAAALIVAIVKGHDGRFEFPNRHLDEFDCSG